ncbi:hypothetical protein C7401_14074 [Paraburkholderia unamae]|uniref:hypothetical protein n=1 Tax=Paraburkholderia unamae TaxID=219649 RepID=UPI000DC5C085|nr:hypothetical protein [Paraburkholderia unamae]RAR50758.1 hypothetical protein C7401_14074 [Paraburkholderia unamae]
MSVHDAGCACRRGARREALGAPRIVSRALRLAFFALQIAAPKCAICWTTYAGLFGASWFAATRDNGLWFGTALSLMFVAAFLSWREARRTRRFAAACASLPGWLLMLAGAFVGIDCIRWAGVAWLGVALALSRWSGWGGRRRIR